MVQPIQALRAGAAEIAQGNLKQRIEVRTGDELEALVQRIPLDLVVTASSPGAGWTGRVGRINEQLLREVLPADAAQRNVVICGPKPMIESTISALASLGIPPHNIYADRFDS